MIHGADGYQGQLSARIEELETQLIAKDAEITRLLSSNEQLGIEWDESNSLVEHQTALLRECGVERGRYREALEKIGMNGCDYCPSGYHFSPIDPPCDHEIARAALTEAK